MVATRFRRAVSTALRRPALLALCGLVGVLEVVTWLLLAPVLAVTSGGSALALVLLQRVALVGVLALLLPGCYAAVREGTSVDGVRDALETAVDRARTGSGSLAVSMAVSRVLALALTLGVLLVLLGVLGVVDTAVVWIEAYAGVGTDRETLALVGVSASVLAASALARGAVGLQDVRAIESADGEPWRGPWWSVEVWRGRLGQLLAYALARGVLLALPLAVAGLVLGVAGPVLAIAGTDAPSTADLPSSAALALAAVAFVGVTSATRATLAAYQIDTYEHASEWDRTTAEDATVVPRGRRVAIAAIVLVAAVAGTAAVRAADVHPEHDDPPPDLVPENADATVETALERTGERDRFVEERTERWNRSTEGWETASHREVLYDRTERQLVFYGHVGSDGDSLDRTVYSTDGRFATLRRPDPPARPALHHVRFDRGSWSVLVGPRYGWAVRDAVAEPPSDAGWRLVEASNDRLVYRLADPGALAGTDLGDQLGMPEGAVAVGNESSVTLVVDRETLTVQRVSARVDAVANPAAEDPRRVRTRLEREVYWLGDVDVDRPDALPSPSLLALLWDVVYY